MRTTTYVSQGASSEYPQHVLQGASNEYSQRYHGGIRKISGHPSYRYGGLNKNLEEG